ncbi:MAG: hypothetical protein P6H82_00840 [Candidatus Arsenophonus melophagi]|nr:hypothetical protein [Candidatus Arsenophonus melophagi]
MTCSKKVMFFAILVKIADAMVIIVFNARAEGLDIDQKKRLEECLAPKFRIIVKTPFVGIDVKHAKQNNH